MNVAIIGYGKMGKTVEKIAIDRGHQIVAIIDVNNKINFDTDAFQSANVAIEFSTPDSAYDNFLQCFKYHIPVVAGTTGWLNKLNDIKKICQDQKETFFYASNFSIGVNVFFAVNRYLAKLMNGFSNYDVSITEVHHTHKLDTPSGTALTLAEDLIHHLDRKTNWSLDISEDPAALFVDARREGEVPGIHEVVYDSDNDFISIKHNSKNRTGFALGAVLAAEFVNGKHGFFTMNDLLKFDS
jgi:4-hydroxy-tetrahydrodipicolinate reductase